LKTILKTTVYMMDQADGATADVRDRVSDTVDRVSDRVSELADRGKDLVYGEDHTLRNIGIFALGVGTGIAAGMLFAPASGDEIRGTVRDKVEDIGDRVRDRFSSSTRARSTGTEGGI
jgi:gas vesicle protein